MSLPVTAPSILDAHGVDPERARTHLSDALNTADDGELFIEQSESESFVFDDGRLKSASYDSAEGFETDFAFADVLVAVEVAAEFALAVVGVDDVDVLEAEEAVGFGQGFSEAGFGGDVVTGGEGVAGVEAEADGEVCEFGRELAHDVEFFELAAELGSAAGGVFEQQCEFARVEALRGFGDTFDDFVDALFDGLAFVVAGVGDQVFGSDGDGAF